MNILEILKNLNKDELERFVLDRVSYLEKEALENEDYIPIIGFNVDINPPFNTNIFFKDDENFLAEAYTLFEGYIPLGTKIVYGMHVKNCRLFSRGKYYYVDDNSYILDFCKYILDKEIYSEFDLFQCLLDFLHKYFGFFTQISRIEMSTMILKDDNYVYPLTNELKISNFKGKGNALCTENALLVQNILTFLGYNMLFVIGDERGKSHSYNLISYKEYEMGIEKNCIIDYSLPIAIENINEKIEGAMPFVFDLEKDIYSTASHLLEGEKIEAPIYYYLDMGNCLLQMVCDEKIIYSAGTVNIDFNCKEYKKIK